MICEHQNDCQKCNVAKKSVVPPVKNAFQMLFKCLSVRASANDSPSTFENPCNKKEELWNDFLNKISETCSFPKSNGIVFKTFLTQRRDTLWSCFDHRKRVYINPQKFRRIKIRRKNFGEKTFGQNLQFNYFFCHKTLSIEDLIYERNFSF